ncbi:MAG: DNA polymerase III subunit delta [Armatimonadetes bacterium]|nr:DNA polymerase III subunit delta [Armatimonadota bacterium]
MARRAHSFLLETFLSAEDREFNHEVLEGENTNAAEVIAHAMSLPFFGACRVVTVRDARRLSADDQKKISAALSSIPPSTRLILIDADSGSGPGGKQSISKQVEKSGMVVDCDAPARDALRSWITAEVATQGKGIEPVAAGVLAELIGNDLNRLSLEIEKIALYMDDQPKITKALVQKLVRKSTEETIFRMTDAVAEKKVAVALRVLDELLQEADSTHSILGMLTRQFRMLAQAKWLMELGYLPGPASAIPPKVTEKLPRTHNILPTLKSQSWLARKLIQQAGLFTEEDITRAFNRLLKADLSLKGIVAPGEQTPLHNPRMTMELLVMQLCGVK